MLVIVWFNPEPSDPFVCGSDLDAWWWCDAIFRVGSLGSFVITLAMGPRASQRVACALPLCWAPPVFFDGPRCNWALVDRGRERRRGKRGGGGDRRRRGGGGDRRRWTSSRSCRSSWTRWRWWRWTPSGRCSGTRRRSASPTTTRTRSTPPPPQQTLTPTTPPSRSPERRRRRRELRLRRHRLRRRRPSRPRSTSPSIPRPWATRSSSPPRRYASSVAYLLCLLDEMPECLLVLGVWRFRAWTVIFGVTSLSIFVWLQPRSGCLVLWWF